MSSIYYTQYYGWLSDKQIKATNKYYIYKDGNNNNINVSCVTRSPTNSSCNIDILDDMVCIGPVYGWVKSINTKD